MNAISHHNLRNSNDIHTIKSNTSLYHNAFLPSTFRQWNSRQVEVRQLNTLSSFETFLKKDLQSVPTYYYCGSRKAQILHARLRTDCSSLKYGPLSQKNITESPLCTRGSIEDTRHYIFLCISYQGPRNTLLNVCTTYQNPTLSLLLFGSLTLSLEAKIAILDQVHKYLLDTKRLPNQESRYLRAIYTYILQVFSLPIGLWCLLLSPTPYPATTQVIFLAFKMMLYFF